MGIIIILQTSKIFGTPIAKTESIRDNPVSQVMLHVLERVVGTPTRPVARGLVIERLHSNGAELFRGITRVTPIMVEYWLKVTERIMNDLDSTPAQKLIGVVSLHHDEAYQWWLTFK